MAIKKTTNRRSGITARRPITANTSITAGVKSRQAMRKNSRIMGSFAGLTKQQTDFARQIQANCRNHGKVFANGAVMGATNTSNIAARPDFIEYLPMFVQKLLILDVFGSVAMKSRQQFIPYFKYVAENTKGETKAGDILSSPMVNRQGLDPNFTGRVVKNEIVESASGSFSTGNFAYLPVLPGSVTLTTNITTGGTQVSTPYVDDGLGNLLDATGAAKGTIDYSTGTVTLTTAVTLADGDTVKSTYQYDNETVGPNAEGNYGAQMGKGQLILDEFDLKAEAHQIANYWSIYSAFAAQQEYGANIADQGKEAAFSELTAEINTNGFKALEQAASYKPQYNWDATPVLSGSVVPGDYLNMFKLKLGQAAASIYQETRLSRPNRLIVGSNTAEYIQMINGFTADNIEDSVGPYKLGRLDRFEVYVEPSYDPDKWVMCCKSDDIRRNSGLFGEYMPFTDTQAIGLANASVQQGYATMYAMKVVNPATVVSGKIIGVF
ncbi:MAG: hypothetical protein NC320_03210 [Clostridium sp.]|nr:hypothetical protein [Clostridium sp.]